MKYITKTIIFLSIISLFMDIASEMLYPIMPMYLKSIGFSVLLIGILEGFAEAVAGVSKGYFGNLSDHLVKREPFVQIGYSLSAISKPFMALSVNPWWIFVARISDRLGKGVRTAARDAMLSAETIPEFKGRVFGFHRAFDTLGAAIGPIVALIFLATFPGEYRTLFLIAFIPGFLAISTSMLIKDNPRNGVRTTQFPETVPSFFSFVRYWKASTPEYRHLVIGLLAFALVNSSDVLLLLMLKHNGASDQQVILVYVTYNLVYAITSFPIGVVGDRIGLRATFVLGLFIFGLVYLFIPFANSMTLMLLLFSMYGIYAASSEGIAKAWISNIVPRNETATAIGFYTGMVSMCTLVASSLAGWIWYRFSPSATFAASAIGTFVIIIYFLRVFRARIFLKS
jgi:MFS family permease